MFVVLYDKDFQALGKRATYLCNSWKLVRKSFEFDELTVTSQKIDYSAKAVFVGLHDQRGRLKYMAFSGVPTTKEGITTIKAVDIRQILDQELIIDLTNVSTVSTLYKYLLELPKNLDVLGATYSVNVSAANGIAWKADAIIKNKEIGNLWDTIQAVNMIYDCFIDVECDFDAKSIVLKVKQIVNVLSLKLEDFGEAKVMNDNTCINRAICKATSNTANKTFYLLKDDSILEKSTLESFKEQVIYPGRIKTFEADTLSEAVSNGLKELYNNRFKQKVEITCDSKLSYIFENIDLDAFGDIYGYNNADNSTYKRLPVSSITEDDKGNKKVVFGRLSPYW